VETKHLTMHNIPAAGVHFTQLRLCTCRCNCSIS